MNAELRQKWIDDLRNPESHQGYGTLRSYDENGIARDCCLGRLCNIIDPEGWEQGDLAPDWSTPAGIDLWIDEDGGEDNVWNHGELNTSVLNHIGLLHSEQEALIRLNDTEKWTFEQIADYIEKNIPAS